MNRIKIFSGGKTVGSAIQKGRKMKTSLYYFSATGNCLAVAREIAEGLPETKLYPIPQVIRSDLPLEGDCVGIIYPVYFGGLPRIISDFIKRLNPENVKYLFVVCTFGAFAAGSLLMAEEQLKAAGIPVNAGYYVPMPGNYIVKYGAYKKEKQKKMFWKKSESVRDIIDGTINQKSVPVKRGNPLFNKIGNAIYQSKLPQFPALDCNFEANDKCNSCGICAKVCPVKNIRIEGPKPVWQGNCEHCMACIQWCPTEAIEYATVTVGRERYRHPDIKMNDLELL